MPTAILPRADEVMSSGQNLQVQAELEWQDVNGRTRMA
jgi:hypothetical protein